MVKANSKPKRKRRQVFQISLRIGPELAKWYAEKAAIQHRSRTQLMELWLAALPEALLEGEKLDPEDAFKVVMQRLGNCMSEFGIAGPVVRLSFGLHQHLAEQEREREAERLGQGEQERKGKGRE